MLKSEDQEKNSLDEITFELITGQEEGVRHRGGKSIPRSYANTDKGPVGRR